MELTDYLVEVGTAWRQLDLALIQQVAVRLEQARRDGSTIFIIGNGGSAATASHFACDLNKLASAGQSPKFRALALADNLAQLTAEANDDRFEVVFLRALENLARRGDVLIALTTSGQSLNIAEALIYARSIEMESILMVGTANSYCGRIAHLIIPTLAPRQTQQEDLMLSVCHLLTEALRVD